MRWSPSWPASPRRGGDGRLYSAIVYSSPALNQVQDKLRPGPRAMKRRGWRLWVPTFVGKGEGDESQSRPSPGLDPERRAGTGSSRLGLITRAHPADPGSPAASGTGDCSAGPLRLASGSHLRTRGLENADFPHPDALLRQQKPRSLILRRPKAVSKVARPQSSFPPLSSPTKVGAQRSSSAEACGSGSRPEFILNLIEGRARGEWTCKLGHSLSTTRIPSRL